MGETRGAGRARSRGRLSASGTAVVHTVIIDASVNDSVTRVQPLQPPAPKAARRALGAACVCLLGAAAGDELETVPDRAPAQLLPAVMVSGADFHVVDPVHGDGLMNHFVLDSRFGSFDAYGRAALAVRIREVAALSELSKTSDVAHLEEELRTALPVTAVDASRELWVAGTVSDRARRAANERGWDVHEVPDGP